MKVLITGGAGFIGNATAKALIRREHKVTIIDNSPRNFTDDAEEGIFLVKGDVRNYDQLVEISKDMDYIFHFAAISSTGWCNEQPDETITTNVLGTWNVLRAALTNNVKRVIFPSSVRVYGKGNKTEVLKENSVLLPSNLYVETKLVGEYLLSLFSQAYGLDTIILRYSDVYGPGGERKGKNANVVMQFISNIRAGISPKIYGDGLQTRDLIHIDDIVKANILAMEYKGEFLGERFNIATGKQTALNELINWLSDVLGAKVNPMYTEDYPDDYMMAQNLDITKAKEILKFKPKIDLVEGIKTLNL